MSKNMFYGLVTDKITGLPVVIKVKSEGYKESPIAAYPRFLAEVADKHQGKYKTSGLQFGVVKIKYLTKKKEGEVYIGMTQVGIVTPRPTIMSAPIVGLVNQTLYFTSTLGMSNDSLNRMYREAITPILGDVVWVME